MNRDQAKKLLEDAAKARGVPYDVLDRVASTESAYNPRAVSPKGARGMFQLMPDTARGLGVTDPFDPAQSANGGAIYLKQLYDKFGDWKLATAAYNAGPGAVKKYGGVPPFKETQNYQKKVWGDDMPKPTNQELIKKGMALAGDLPPSQFQTAANQANPPDTKAYAGASYSTKPSKLDTALGVGSGVLSAVAELLGQKQPKYFSPVSAAGHGAAPITGGQSYNAGALQKQYGMQVTPYQSAIFSLLRGG